MNESISLLKSLLDASALRNEALASNIANVDTPGYRRQDVSFIKELKEAIQSGKKDALNNWSPHTKTARQSAPIRLESEFAALSQNQLLYTTSAELLSRRYASIQRAIKGN